MAKNGNTRKEYKRHLTLTQKGLYFEDSQEGEGRETVLREGSQKNKINRGSLSKKKVFSQRQRDTLSDSRISE